MSILQQERQSRIALVLTLIIAIFLITAAPPQEFIRDSLAWARAVDQGSNFMWFPHHLVYMPVNSVILKTLTMAGIDANALMAGRIHSVFWSMLLAVSALLLFSRLLGSALLGLLFSLLILSYHSVWILLMQPQSYVASYALMLGLTLILFATREQTASRPWLLVLLYALSILYHQAMVLIGLPMALYLTTTRKTGWKTATQVIGLTGAVVLILYCYATYVVTGSLSWSKFWEYITLFAQVMSDPNYFNFGQFRLDKAIVLTQSTIESIVIPLYRLGLYGHGLATQAAFRMA